MHQNSYVDVKPGRSLVSSGVAWRVWDETSRSPCGLHKLCNAYSGACTHSYLSSLESLHPGVTGLCFIVKGLVGDTDR